MSKIKFELAITGMHCAACSSRIERVVSKMAEVERVSVSLPTNRCPRIAPRSPSKKVSAKKRVLMR